MMNCLVSIYAEYDPSFGEIMSCYVSPIDFYDRWLNSAILDITCNGYVGNMDLV